MFGTIITDKQYKDMKLAMDALSDRQLVLCLDSVKAVLNKLNKDQLNSLPVIDEINYFFENLMDIVSVRFSKFVNSLNNDKSLNTVSGLRKKYCSNCNTKNSVGCNGCVILNRISELGSRRLG